jgi:peptidoglycan/LPS O-acetylase OafA/YrhL
MGLALIYPPPLPVFHLWSLAVEEQFYLFWPLLMMLARTRRAAMSLALWIFTLSAIFRFAIWGLPVFNTQRFNGVYDQFLFTHMGALALGAALALALRSSRPGRQSTSSRAVAYWGKGAFYLGIAVYLYISYVSGGLYLRYPLQFFVGLPAISLAAAAGIPFLLRVGPVRALFTISPLRRMGRISYGFYVFHLLLQPLFDRISRHLCSTNMGNLYQSVRLIVAFVITLIVASLSYHLLELPFLRMKRWFPLDIHSQPLHPESNKY